MSVRGADRAAAKGALWRRVVVQASPDQARARLRQLIANDDDDYAGLDRLLGRRPGYLRRYVREGTPVLLLDRDRETLARYFRVDERELGGAEPAADVS